MSPIATCAMRKQVRRAIERLLRTLALAELSVVCMHESWHHERCTNEVVVRGPGDLSETCEGDVGSLSGVRDLSVSRSLRGLARKIVCGCKQT
jgi:hypothetical protein